MTRAALRHTTVSRRRRGTTTTRRRRSRRCRNDVVVRHVAAAATTTSCVAVVTADGVLSLFDGVLVLDLSLLQTTQPRHLSATQRQLINDTLIVQLFSTRLPNKKGLDTTSMQPFKTRISCRRQTHHGERAG